MPDILPRLAKSDPHNTPAMRQFHRFKEQHPGCVLFFRMGDFYEMFYDDAELAHKVLGVTLTQRTKGIPMAGVPYHAVDGYLRRMIQAGHRVAVCDQVQDAKDAKGVVERDVTRVITPGTLTDESLLEEGAVNPLVAVSFLDDETVACAWAELSTGAFSVATFEASALVDELARIGPRELLYCDTATGDVPPRVGVVLEALGCVGAGRPAWQFRVRDAGEALCRQYAVKHLAGFGFADDDAALGPAGAVLHYLLETQRADDTGRLPHLRPPKRYERAAHLVVDRSSLASLEVERTLRTGGTDGTLLGVLQQAGGCVTAMGKRLLRQWLCYPLCDRDAIEQRQDAVATLVDDARLRDELRDALKGVQDVERMAGRLSVGRATPRDLVALGTSAAQAAALAQTLDDTPALAPLRERLVAVVDALLGLGQRIVESCVESPPLHLREGGLIADGIDPELDETRGLKRDATQWLAEYQARLLAETGLPQLKVGFNKVFGYYIELTRANRDKAPDDWVRKQTLKNAERFITDELKRFEGKVLSADARAVAREQAIFAELSDAARAQLPALRELADVTAELDVLACFAQQAVRLRYVRPAIVDEPVLRVTNGRHPVLDRLLGDRFVPNDIALGSGPVAPWHSGPAGTSDPATQRPSDQADGALGGAAASDSATGPLGHSGTAGGASLALITGPNMAGKSTYIRQAALITLLAHTGCFVPAEAATIGLTDRIFTRVGASDELHTGQSTFMVEMTETANLCHHATRRSLVILDEIGRGTSTLDGLSLAWAITEHLAERGCRCLFATHYHELTRLADELPSVANLHVQVREWRDEIVFLHRILAGATDRSYGIHVGKLAGLPPGVIERANALLDQLEVSGQLDGQAEPARPGRRREPQLSLFTEYVEHPAVTELKAIDLDAMTPMQAFDALRALRERVTGDDA